MRLAVVGLLALGACAALPPCPARGGPAWLELTTEHLDLFTDLDAPDAQELLRSLEDLRLAVHVAAWRRAPEPPGHVTVIVTAGERERRVFEPAPVIAWLVTTGALHQTLVVTSGDEPSSTRTIVLAGAMAHHYGLANKVPWFDEGLGRYLAPLTIADDGTLTYGQVDAELFRLATRGNLMSFANLWEGPRSDRRDAFIATSWVAVHYLFNHEPERMAELQRQLVTTEDARATWRAIFPDLTDDVMDDRLDKYLFWEGTMSTFKVRLPPTQDQATVTAVDDAQVHALRAMLYASAPQVPRAEARANASREVAEALQAAPDQLLARFVQRLYLHDEEADLSVPVRLVATYPNNVMSWATLARAHEARGMNEERQRDWDQIHRLTGGLDPPDDLSLRVARPD